ncbi:MAG: DinB family protein [Anaerolineae bacterium]|nr:DinB family protein [Anaerolineae bacterium]
MLKELEPLIAQYARSRQVLFDCIAGLNDAQLDECFPGRDWSIKDTCIHLATNEALMTNLLREIANGGPSSLPADFDNQKFNDDTVAAGHTKNMKELHADLDTSYRNLIAVLESVTPEQLTRVGTHPAAGHTTVKEFFLAMYAHHEMHCRDVVEQSRRLKKS